MLEIDNTCLVIVDVQGKLAQLMYNSDTLFKNIQILIKGCKILDIPVIWCQQTPKAIGATVPQIANLLTDIEPVNKACFSCCMSGEFAGRLKALNRKQIILCGIEAHVCIYQTAMDLIKDDFEVNVICDGISSRTLENKQTAIERMEAEGVKISSAEIALFELLKTSEHPNFRQIIELIK